MTDDSYHAAIATLATAEGRRAAEVNEVMNRYDTELAAHEAALRQADAAVENAAARAEAATTLLDKVEYEAQRLWLDLRAVLGKLAAARLGPVPAPDDSVAPGTSPLRHLQAARKLLDDARRPRPLRRVVYFILPFLGALCGIALGVLARWATRGVDFPRGIAVAVAVLGAPALAILVARWATRREGARLDGGSVGGTVIGALVAVSVMLVFIR